MFTRRSHTSRSMWNSITNIQELFDEMDGHQASNWQKRKVAKFKQAHPELIEDLSYCFEILAGKYKLGYKIEDKYMYELDLNSMYIHVLEDMRSIQSIKEFHKYLSELSAVEADKTRASIMCVSTGFLMFFMKLFNREYKLGYSGLGEMVSNKHPMLAKSYPTHMVKEKRYIVQEKLNGNRCIAYYEDGKWNFMSRSQKPLKVEFDMTGMDTNRIYDGEIMTKNKMGNKDFTKLNGIINSKFADKSCLIYFIYDILDASKPYTSRAMELEVHRGRTSHNVEILKSLGTYMVYKDLSKNTKLDNLLDNIVEQGGEGIMLRDPDAYYHHSKSGGDRKPYLLKYKKTKTCDLRIVGWNEGKGKYEGAIGSFICRSDCGTVEVNVAGMSDDIRFSDPDDYMGTIIEVTYFEGSKSKNKTTRSLQFPRILRLRDDKSETSLF